MKGKNKNKTRPMKVIRLWTLPQAEKALPYLRSVTGSLREHWLEGLSRQQELRNLSKRPGRPDRTALIAHASAVKGQEDAEDRFGTALQELMNIDAYLLDPVEGVVFIPFNKDNELAWFIFDLFEEGGLKSWRLHSDSMETRRPMAEVEVPLIKVESTADSRHA